jgi:MFS family permease
MFSASLIFFLIYRAVRFVAYSMSQSFMALYLVEERGLSGSLASLYIGSNTLMGLVAAPIGGFLAVRYGEKRWLLTVLVFAYTCFGLAISIPANGGFFAFYLAYGFLNYLGMASSAAIMAKLSPGKQRGLAYALFFLPSSLIGAVAPLLAASVAEAFGLTSIFYAAILTFFASLAVLAFGVRVPSS